jgi:hypothetical protein
MKLKKMETKGFARLLGSNFRALSPDKLNASVLAMCREIACEHVINSKAGSEMELAETAND